MTVLALLALLVLLSLSAQLAVRVRPDADAPGEPDDAPSPVARAWAAVRRGPQPARLPEGHRPPAGLGPLSPSERFLSGEAARGIRALQLFLLDQAA